MSAILSETPTRIIDLPRTGEKLSDSRQRRRRSRKFKIHNLTSQLTSAVFWFFGCAAIGIVMLIVGVFILAGLGWGVIAIGLAFILAALGLQIGIARG